jgi:hypothetical protein
LPDVLAELRQLREELKQVRAELDSVKQQQAQGGVAVAPVPGAGAWSTYGAGLAPGQAPAAAAVAAAQPALPRAAENPLSFFGYGEMNYSRPRNNASGATATLRRGVLGFAYRFDERTRMAAELEVENAVASASDQGEVEFEQMYIEHDLSDSLSAKAGLFLMPVGYLNESHEPTRYFGVNRNLIETAIIPSTWRDGPGPARHHRGRPALGCRSGHEFRSGQMGRRQQRGRDSPLGAIHQEGQLAKARNAAVYGALNYNGLPGFNIGGSVFNGGVGQKQTGFAHQCLAHPGRAAHPLAAGPLGPVGPGRPGPLQRCGRAQRHLRGPAHAGAQPLRRLVRPGRLPDLEPGRVRRRALCAL